MDDKEFQILDCAFFKFFALRCPVLVDTRVYGPAHRDTLHSHDFPQLWYCLSGECLHRVGDQIYECAKGSLIRVPSGVCHKFWTRPGGEVELMSVSVMYDAFLNTPPGKYVNAIANLFLPAFSGELGHIFPVYTMLSRESQMATEDITSWLASLKFTPPDVELKTKTYEKLEQLCSLPELALPENCREKVVRLAQMRLRPIVKALVYLNLHYPEKIAETDLLQASAICRTDFYAYFKRFTGYTCLVYLQRLRARRAFAYITFTKYPLSYISDICGFTDQAHMSRTYKKYVGMTPGASRTVQRKWLEEHPNSKLNIAYLE